MTIGDCIRTYGWEAGPRIWLYWQEIYDRLWIKSRFRERRSMREGQ